MKSLLIKNAHVNNLKNVSLSIPKNKITVFTGVSGSGKSSLVFDTIGAEAQRQLNDTYDSYIRNRLPQMPRPDVESVENLNVAVLISQKKIGGNARSTLGTATDTYALLRLLFSRYGQPFIGYSNRFSFNNPQGMCPRCEGLGKISGIDTDQLLDGNKSLNQGAIRFPTFQPGGFRWLRYVQSGYFDNDKKLKDYTKIERELLLYADPHKPAKPSPEWGKTVLYEGIVPRIHRSFLKRDSKEFSRYRAEISRVISTSACPECGGSRVNETVRSCHIHGKNIADCAVMQIDELYQFLSGITDRKIKGLVEVLLTKLQHLLDLGLAYLNLNRETASLSGGESQRVKMVKHLGSSLTDLIYIFDEPSTGLHPADVDRLNQQMRQLRDKGNTLLVVEHDPDVIAIADHVVDMGPGAGNQGGEIIFTGTLSGLKRSNGQTGQYFRQKRLLNVRPARPSGFLELQHVHVHNLKDVSVRFPTGVLTVVTGVAGSGKSSLVNVALPRQFPEVRIIDQRPLRGSRRSHLASYAGIFDEIRRLFARSHGVSPSLFSRNGEGACPECKGLGRLILDLAFLDDVVETCDVCGGSGYKDDVLQYTYQTKNIAEVMALDVRTACTFFSSGALIAVLERLERTGLGYMSLGQSLDTFSGGERQRLKLATELQNGTGFYIFDEPTSGLHHADVEKLMQIFGELIAGGSSVLLIEHNLDVIRQADWIIDVGPGAGTAGGAVVFTGTPEQLLNCKTSVTGKYLRNFIDS